VDAGPCPGGCAVAVLGVDLPATHPHAASPAGGAAGLAAGVGGPAEGSAAGAEEAAAFPCGMLKVHNGPALPEPG
jgi:hypothetical protein